LKDDDGKPRPDRIDPRFLLEIGRVDAYGETKYSAHGWRNQSSPEPYLAAAYRHLLKVLDGELYNADDGDGTLHHLAHVAWNAAAAWWIIHRKLGGIWDPHWKNYLP